MPETRAQQRREGLRNFMNMRGLKMLPWANKAQVSESTIRNFLAGRSDSLRQDVVEALAEAEGVSPAEIFGEGHPRRVRVLNYIGAGARVFPIDDYPKGGGMYDVEAPEGEDPDSLVALEIRGNSMRPLKPGWIIMYRRRHEGIEDGSVGELCAVGLEDGSMYIKDLRQGYEPETFNLESWADEPIVNARVKWAAKIRWIKPK